MRKLFACLALAGSALCLPERAAAQYPREYYGLYGSMSWTQVSLEFDSAAAQTRAGATVRLGLRVCVLCFWDITPFTLTPGMAFAITDVRGMTRDEDPYAFSRLDFGVQGAWRVHRHIRPYAAWWFKTKRTAQIERDTLTFGEPGPARLNDWPIDFVDPKGNRDWTFGVEIPLTLQGRGFDIAYTKLGGAFTENEFRKRTIPPMRLGYSGWTLAIGYTGPFTGSGLFWR
jgi:hypothetical protein